MNTHNVSLRQYLAETTLHRHDYHQIVLPQVGTLELEVGGHGGHVASGIGAFICDVPLDPAAREIKDGEGAERIGLNIGWKFAL